MKIQSLKNDIGILITDCPLNDMTASDYDAIRDLYLKHPVLVIRQNDINLLNFAKICASIGNIANEPFEPFTYTGSIEEIPHQRVTGIMKDGKPTGIFGQGRLDWHCNMNGPNRAAGVGLLAVFGVEGSVTSWMSTIPAFADLSEEKKAEFREIIGHYNYSPDTWAPGMHPWQREGMLAVAKKDGEYTMPLIQKSLDGRDGMYFHFLNSCRFPSNPELFDFLKAHCFQDKYVYDHHWEPGDIVLSDQLITLHKRQTDEVSNRLLYRYTFHHPNHRLDQIKEIPKTNVTAHY